jgi:hypothetical protein
VRTFKIADQSRRVPLRLVLPAAPTIFPGAIPIQLSNSQGKEQEKSQRKAGLR